VNNLGQSVSGPTDFQSSELNSGTSAFLSMHSPTCWHPICMHLGTPSSALVLLQAQLYIILEMCRAFDKIFKEHLDGG